jgi:pimeloyl-ACP methyl ester carboxylesterase
MNRRCVIGTLCQLYLGLATAAALSATSIQDAATRRSFDVGILHVERSGSAERRPIILIAGTACGPWVWDRQLTGLARAYDVYAVTLPGFDGRSMVGGDKLAQRAMQSLHQLIVTQHLVRAVIVGHSLGGYLALMFAEAFPRDYAGIVAVEGGYPIAATQKERNELVLKASAPYRELSRSQFAATFAKNELKYMITRKSDLLWATNLAGRSDPAAAVAWMGAVLPVDVTPKMTSISAPFTAIIPFDPQIDPDQGFATERAKLDAYIKWASHARKGRVVLIQPARHFVMLDRPHDFGVTLESAIERQ